jgi:hypothetical protein
VNLYQIKAAVAAYFDKPIDAMNVNDVDIALIAFNQVRTNAELNNDFEFTRKLLTLDIDGVTGGSLDSATEYGSEEDTSFEIKTILDVGTFDTDGNFRPVEWTTVGDTLNRERLDNPMYSPRFPTDAQAISGPIGQRRFVFTGNKVFYFPKTPNLTITLGIEAYTFSPDWDVDDLATDASDTGDSWLRKGHMYLQWASMIHINHAYKQFVFRQEGNLPPPQNLADSALVTFQTWDTFRYEQFRRHSR